MTLSISSTLQAVRDRLASEMGDVDVFMGGPGEETPGLYIYPISVDPLLAPLRPGGRQSSSPPADGLALDCLLLAEPADAFDLVDRARSVVLASPVLRIDATTLRLVPQTVSRAELAAVFLAAGISYRICVGLHIEATASGRAR